jgi:hypothetical protein
MALTVRIPRKISQKRSIKGHGFIVSHPTGDYEDFTFNDYTAKNITMILDSLYLPVDRVDALSPNSFTTTKGSVVGPVDTYFHTKEYGPATYDAIAHKIKQELAGDLVIIDQAQAASTKQFVYTLSNEDMTICVSLSGARIITESEEFIDRDLSDYISENTVLTCQRFIHSDLKFKSLSRDIVSNFIKKSVGSKKRKRKVKFKACALLPKTTRVAFCHPVLQSTSQSCSVFNRILNKTIKYKFRGFTKLGSNDKTTNIQRRIDKLYADCLPQIEANFDKYCGGVENWSLDGDRYRTVGDCDRRTQFVNHAAGSTWAAPKDEDTVDFFNVYYAHNILEKYLLSLDALPIEMDKNADEDYKLYSSKILSLFMYAKHIRQNIQANVGDVNSYVGRSSKVESLESIPFKQLYIRIPHELHVNLIKNIQPTTAITAVLTSAVKKQTKVRLLALPSIELSTEEDALMQDLLKHLHDSTEFEKTLTSLIKTV